VTVRIVFEDYDALLQHDAETAEEVIALMLVAGEVYLNDGIRLWLDAPQPRFGGGRTPRQMIADGDIAKARAILEGMADGVFV